MQPEREGALLAYMESQEPSVKSQWLARGAVAGMRWLGLAVLDQLYPPVCLRCEAPTAHSDGLCAGCFAQLRPISAPLCPRLGIPFEFSLGADAVSAEALADPPPFERARAAVVYNEVARTLISRLKYRDRPELAKFCARLMASAGHELWAGKPAVLVPVPLHRRRQRERRYNQSAEMALHLSRLTGVVADLSLVSRIKPTRQQVGLSSTGRQRNVQGAFAVHPDLPVRLAGRRVVLVDDVYTTGATTKAVTRVLLRAGVEQVDVITFARVVVGEEEPI
ncbi:ComF family protein [Devosia sp. 1566]|uniref:ComF family protein n=1 Tax=Devosia sp. 1566 TaxID=2499144 RepID=UPI0020C15FAB|nr:ComF family protein [Devosia sp. 1566]